MSNLTISSLRLKSIKGESFNVRDQGEQAGFAAQFKGYLEHRDSIEVGDEVKARLVLDCTVEENEDPVFSIEVLASIRVGDESGVSLLQSKAGARNAAELIFPFLRQLANPILESLSSSDIEFPFNLPPEVEPHK